MFHKSLLFVKKNYTDKQCSGQNLGVKFLL